MFSKDKKRVFRIVFRIGLKYFNALLFRLNNCSVQAQKIIKKH